MLKKIIIGSLGCSSLAFASETRVNTLQNLSGVQDPVDVFMYSGLVNEYNAALIELGTSDNSNVWGGAMTKVSSGISAGFAVNRRTWLSSYGLSSFSVQDLFMDAAVDTEKGVFSRGSRSIDLLLGLSLGSNSSLGFRLSTAKDGAKTSSSKAQTSSEKSMAASQLAVGFSSVGESAIDVDLQVTFGESYKAQEKTAASDTSLSLTGKTDAALKGRWLQSSKGSGVFANGYIMTRSSSVKQTAAGTSKSKTFKDQGINLGGGYAHQSEGSKGKLFVGGDLTKLTSKGPSATDKLELSDKDLSIDTQVLSVALSGEGKFYGDFGMMFGGSYPIYGTITEENDNDETKTETQVSTSSANLWDLGIYYATDVLRVDASFSKQLLHNGPNFISGNQTSPMLARISATYNF